MPKVAAKKTIKTPKISSHTIHPETKATLELFGYDNIHKVPVLDKVVVSMGIGSIVTRKSLKDL
jgi:ribosomal protein L5